MAKNSSRKNKNNSPQIPLPKSNKMKPSYNKPPKSTDSSKANVKPYVGVGVGKGSKGGKGKALQKRRLGARDFINEGLDIEQDERAKNLRDRGWSVHSSDHEGGKGRGDDQSSDDDDGDDDDNNDNDNDVSSPSLQRFSSDSSSNSDDTEVNMKNPKPTTKKRTNKASDNYGEDSNRLTNRLAKSSHVDYDPYLKADVKKAKPPAKKQKHELYEKDVNGNVRKSEDDLELFGGDESSYLLMGMDNNEEDDSDDSDANSDCKKKKSKKQKKNSEPPFASKAAILSKPALVPSPLPSPSPSFLSSPSVPTSVPALSKWAARLLEPDFLKNRAALIETPEIEPMDDKYLKEFGATRRMEEEMDRSMEVERRKSVGVGHTSADSDEEAEANEAEANEVEAGSSSDEEEDDSNSNPRYMQGLNPTMISTTADPAPAWANEGPGGSSEELAKSKKSLAECKIRINNLAFNTTIKTLTSRLESFSSTVNKDKDDNMSKLSEITLLPSFSNPALNSGRAYATFWSADDAKSCCLGMNEKDFDNRIIRVAQLSDLDTTSDSNHPSRSAPAFKFTGSLLSREKDISTKCFKCLEIGHISVNCPNPQVLPPCPYCGVAHAPVSNGRSSYGGADRMGSGANNCPNQVVCFACQTPGHAIRDCTNVRVSAGGRSVCTTCSLSGHDRTQCRSMLWHVDMREAMCLNCGKNGHFMCEKIAWKNSGSSSLKGAFCSNCGRAGHFGQECRRPGLEMCIRNAAGLEREIQEAFEGVGGVGGEPNNNNNGSNNGNNGGNNNNYQQSNNNGNNNNNNGNTYNSNSSNNNNSNSYQDGRGGGTYTRFDDDSDRNDRGRDNRNNSNNNNNSYERERERANIQPYQSEGQMRTSMQAPIQGHSFSRGGSSSSSRSPNNSNNNRGGGGRENWRP